ncbi:NADPH-dependent F420 reductase [Cohnella soli]|uniref:NADPH-dependent F420 reductase n=1 Tax=Cohnella soli TaxID=425005 RepID=A0ABW0HZ13_9BACL
MNIGIVGAGNVGKILGKGLVAAGHCVAISGREPHDPKHLTWKQEVGASGDITSFNEAALFGELIIVALPWSCLKDVVETINPIYWKNKTVIDISNAVHFDGGLRLQLVDTSAGEIVQQLLPESHVVKTLNNVNDKIMVDPKFNDGTPLMFVSGNNPSSKNQAQTLLKDLGWSTIVDLGDIRQSRLQESIMVACVISEIQLQSPGSAFALLQC